MHARLLLRAPLLQPRLLPRLAATGPGSPGRHLRRAHFGEGTVGHPLPRPRVRRPDDPLDRAPPRFAAWPHANASSFSLAFFGSRLGALAGRNLGAASDRSLVETRRAATSLAEEAFRRHVLGTAISGASYLLLDLFLKKNGIDEALGGGVTARLTAGARGNVLAEANETLHELARIAAQDPLVERALVEGPASAALRDRRARPVGAGHSRAVARSFADTWRRFLDEHGHRAEREAELAAPRWVEDPREVISVA